MAPVLIGEFEELGAPGSAPRMADSVGYLSNDDRELVVRYLERGVAISATPGTEVDVLDGAQVDLTPSLLTDGEHVWRRDLIHYVRKYGVAVPESFLAVVRSGASPPETIEGEQASALGSWLRARRPEGS